MATTQDRLDRVLVRVMGPLNETLTPTASLVDDLGMDSLDVVELVVEMEKEFKIEVSELEGDRLQSWGDCIKLVNKLVEEKRKAAKVAPPAVEPAVESAAAAATN